MDRRVMIKKMKTSTPVKGLVKVPYTRTPGMHRFSISETNLELNLREIGICRIWQRCHFRQMVLERTPTNRIENRKSLIRPESV